MTAANLLKIIRDNLDTHEEVEMTSLTMYDPNHWQYKVSFSVFEKTEKGVFKRFTITVDDNIKPIINLF